MKVLNPYIEAYISVLKSIQSLNENKIYTGIFNFFTNQNE